MYLRIFPKKSYSKEDSLEGLGQFPSWMVSRRGNPFLHKSWRYNASWPTVISRMTSALRVRAPGCKSSGESLNAWNSTQVWMAAPGWWGFLQPVKSRSSKAIDFGSDLKDYSLMLNRSLVYPRTLHASYRWVYLFVCNCNMITKNSLAYN